MSADEVGAKLPDLCASYQQAVVDSLARKTRFALETGRYRSLGLSGGVANNRTLRGALAVEAGRARIPLLAADPRHTGDNAAMIAFAAWADADNPDSVKGMGIPVEPSAALA
jgi:N6-L-threonylcarbamoyladenine synthase